MAESAVSLSSSIGSSGTLGESPRLRHPLVACLHSLLSDEAGLSTVEYALLLATVALVAIAAFVALGNREGVVLGNTSRDIGTGPSS